MLYILSFDSLIIRPRVIRIWAGGTSYFSLDLCHGESGIFHNYAPLDHLSWLTGPLAGVMADLSEVEII